MAIPIMDIRKLGWSVMQLYSKTKGTFPSSNGLFQITYYVYTPKTPPRGLLQITHGMCEYLERYEPFIEFLTGQGFMVAGHDHAGHGNSIRSLEDLGYFSEDAQDLTLARDLKIMSDLLSENHPDLPHFILGHSMGSFILRKHLTRFGRNLSGIIISGTGGSNPAIPLGLNLARTISRVRGDSHRSTLFNSVFFQGFNRNFKEENNRFSWLTRDKDIVAAYDADPKCNFIFTLNGFKGFLDIMREVTEEDWAGKTPRDVPYLLFSGKEDPVGNYGKGVTETHDSLLDSGVKNVTLRLYEDGRHEMLNELNREEVYGDLLAWMEGILQEM